MARAGTAYVDVVGNFKPLEAQLAAKQGSLGKSVGKIFKAGAVGAAGLGVAAVKLATDFDQAMTRVSTQAGASRKEVDSLRGKILDLAKASEFSPKELADGLFRVESAGFRGAKAMDVLKKSQDLAAVGGSNLEATTNAVVGAINSHIKGTETAAKTVGTLNAAIGQGNLRMEDMVGALSTGILPAAKTFGLSLRDVTAAIDVMTKRGVPAQAAATRLRMTFSLMGAPTAKAAAALSTIGLKSDTLAKAMQQPNGLVKAVTLLHDHLQGLSRIKQAQVLSEAFGGGRTSSAIMTLVQNYKDLGRIYDTTGKQAGKFGEAVRRQAETPAARFKVAWNNIEVSLINLGSKIAPKVAKEFEKLGKIISDPKLTTEQKWDKISKEIGDKISEAVPVLAKLAAKLAPKVALGFVKGFINAGPWGQLLITAFLVKKFGGWGAFGKLGRRAGGGFAGGFGGGVDSGAIGKSGSRMGKVFGVAFRAAAILMVGELAVDLGKTIGDKLRDTPFGRSLRKAAKDAGLQDPLTDFGRSIGVIPSKKETLQKALGDKQLGRDVFQLKGPTDTRGLVPKKTEGRHPIDSPAAGVDRQGKDVERKTKEWGRKIGTLKWPVPRLQKFESLRPGVDKMLGEIKRLHSGAEKKLIWKLDLNAQTKSVKTTVDSFLKDFKRLPPGVQKEARKTALNQITQMQQMGLISAKKAEDMRSAINKKTKDIASQTSSHAKDMRSGMLSATASMVSGVASGIGSMGADVNKALDALGVKKVSFGSSAADIGKKVTKKAGGGWVGSPGERGPDVVPALLGRGEAVLNAPQQSWVEPALRKEYGFGLRGLFGRETRRHSTGGFSSTGKGTQAFSTGGFAPGGFRGGPPNNKIVGLDGARVSSAIKNMVAKFIQTYALHITAGYDPGGGHVSPGHNIYGTATDLVPRAGNWDREEQGLGKLVRSGFTVLYDGRVGTTPYPNHGRGNHAHVEWWPIPKGANSIFSGLAGVGAAIAKRVLSGPDGALKGMGQASLDKVHKAAQAYIDKQSPDTSAVAAGDIGGSIVTASTFGGPGDPGTGSVGYRGDDLNKHPNSFAELNMGTALGGLPHNARIKVGYNGKNITVLKRDIGAGGPGLHGHTRAIDLWYQAAQRLGLSGLADVSWTKAGGGGFMGDELLALASGGLPSDYPTLKSPAKDKKDKKTKAKRKFSSPEFKRRYERFKKLTRFLDNDELISKVSPKLAWKDGKPFEGNQGAIDSLNAQHDRVTNAFGLLDDSDVPGKVMNLQKELSIDDMLTQVYNSEGTIYQRRQGLSFTQAADLGQLGLTPDLLQQLVGTGWIKHPSEIAGGQPKSFGGLLRTRLAELYQDRVLAEFRIGQRDWSTRQLAVEKAKTGTPAEQIKANKERIAELHDWLDKHKGDKGKKIASARDHARTEIRHLGEEDARLQRLPKNKKTKPDSARGKRLSTMQKDAESELVHLTGRKSISRDDVRSKHVESSSMMGVLFDQVKSLRDQRSTEGDDLSTLVRHTLPDHLDHIESVKKDIRELGVQAPSTESSDLTDNLRTLLQQMGLRYAVSQAQYPVLFPGAPPFGGVFHEGGIVPGPSGAERMVLAQGGELITPEGDGPNVRVVIEDNRVRVFANDVEQAVETVTRRQARGGRRALPSGSRSLVP